MREAKGVLAVQLAGVEFDREHGLLPPGLSPGKYLWSAVSGTGQHFEDRLSR